MSKNGTEPKTETIAETENYLAWKAKEPDGEITYHLELGNVTMHFFEEEWAEFLEDAKDFKTAKPDEDGFFSIEFYNVGVWLEKEDWSEFKNLMDLIKNDAS
jgi:hypothetical protein